MKIFKRYLSYRLESSMLRTLIFTILSVMLAQMVLSEATDSSVAEYNDSGLYILATILGIIASVIPFLELAGFNNRRNLDTLYFFPIKREKMAIANYISGFVQVLFIYTVTFVWSYIYLATKTNYFALYHMLPYYFLSVLLGLVIYSVFMFIFVQANSSADGVIFCLLWIFLLCVVGYTVIDILEIRGNLEDIVYNYFSWNTAYEISSWGIIYAPINNLTVLFQDLIEINNPTAWDYTVVPIKNQLYMFFVWGAIGIAAAVGYVWSFVRKGAEKAGEISISWFGYRTLIPIYGYCMIILTRGNGGPSSITVLSFILMIIGYVIYRRGFKLKTSDIIATACGLIPMLLTIAL